MAQKDFYKTLGVTESASADEIKKAYRKLAKKLHPDATGGDKTKTARFKEVTEANETLSDAKRRGAYDEARRNPFSGGAPPGGGNPFAGGVNVDLDELLRKMGQQRGGGGRGPGNPFGGGGGGGGGGFADIFGDMFAGQAGGQKAPRRGEDVVAKLEVDLLEAALGGEKVVNVDGRRLTIKIPAGVTDGKTIRLAGQGHPGGRGSPAGDLLIELHERPNPQFRRKAPGSPDIEVDLPVAVDVALLGGKADVKTMEGTTISLTVPPGTSSGKKMRVRAKGAVIPGGHDGARGDLYANVSIQVPEKLSDKARELIQEFAKLTKK